MNRAPPRARRCRRYKTHFALIKHEHQLRPVQPVRVFISYSHDSPEHLDRVLALAQQLRRDGVDAELDQFHQNELVHRPRWCEEQLRPETSRWVVCVCIPEYKDQSAYCTSFLLCGVG